MAEHNHQQHDVSLNALLALYIDHRAKITKPACICQSETSNTAIAQDPTYQVCNKPRQMSTAMVHQDSYDNTHTYYIYIYMYVYIYVYVYIHTRHQHHPWLT